MLALQKATTDKVASAPIVGRPLEDLLTKKWLLTNERGGYASSTIVGCNTRRYHGLLIGSLNPLANRIMGLANCLEMVIFSSANPLCNNSQNENSKRIINLSTFEFKGKFAPEGFKYMKRFRRDTGVHFDYQLGTVELTKSIYLLRDSDTVAVVYDFTIVGAGLTRRNRRAACAENHVEFVMRPFAGLRDFHSLQKSYAPLCSAWLGGGLAVRHEAPGSCELFLRCPAMDFRRDPQWWFNFIYRNDSERGQDFTEDLWSPGFFKCSLDSAKKIVFWANLSSLVSDKDEKTGNYSNRHKGKQPLEADIESALEDLQKHQENAIRKARSTKPGAKRALRNTNYETLCLAADQFVAKRHLNGVTGCKDRTTVLAGYPWFADWGRDAFVALPGLLLLTGRFDDAKSVLTTFAQAADEGMIPNRFDDRGDTAYFNSIDASLWFINAAFEYLYSTADSKTFTQQLLPIIHWIIDSFYNGTRFGIHADADELITGGTAQTQLTWMDAKYEGVAFTARYGKAVEVNALWYNSLCRLAQFYTGRDIEAAKHYKTLSGKVAASFCELFWNDRLGHLNDCIAPDGSVDTSLRPNQIFAVSLPFSPLSSEQQKCVVDAVQKDLLTPYGLRTLPAADSRYRGQYAGPQRHRDEAYHQGTVWPYLIGPFVEAYLKVNGFSRKSRRKTAEFIQPLLYHLTEDGCLGQVCEIFDGDAPHKPRGCVAQAWSVAELIRACHLIKS